MHLSSAKTGFGQSLISWCLFLLLIIIALAVFAKQFSYDPVRFNTDSAVRSSQQVPSPVAGLLSSPPAGLKNLSDPETFTAETLYTKIDGKADLYLESGFRKLYCRRFVEKNDANLWMEAFLYDMGSPRNAFAVYSVQKRPDAEILPYLPFACKTRNAVFVCTDKYYLELLAATDSAQLLEAMLSVAGDFVQSKKADQSTIPELQLFPQANLVPQSYKLYLSAAFGFDGFTDVFLARYSFGDVKLTAFLSVRPTAADAEKLADSYYKFLIENGATDKSKIAEAVKGKALDFDGTTEIVFTVGHCLAGVHAAENEQLAIQLAAELYDKLKNRPSE